MSQGEGERERVLALVFEKWYKHDVIVKLAQGFSLPI